MATRRQRLQRYILATSDILELRDLAVPDPRRQANPVHLGTRPLVLVSPVGGGAYRFVSRGADPARLVSVDSVDALICDPLPHPRIDELAQLDAFQVQSLESRSLFAQSLSDLGLPDDQIAQLLGTGTSDVSLLRALHRACPVLRLAVFGEGPMTFGHARCLLKARRNKHGPAMTPELQEQWVRAFLNPQPPRRPDQLPPSVAEFSRLVRHGMAPASQAMADPDVAEIAREVGRRLGTEVAIEGGFGGAGQLSVTWDSAQQLIGLFVSLARLGLASSPTAPSTQRPPRERVLRIEFQNPDELHELIGAASHTD